MTYLLCVYAVIAFGCFEYLLSLGRSTQSFNGMTVLLAVCLAMFWPVILMVVLLVFAVMMFVDLFI
jgi:hypothetical protein